MRLVIDALELCYAREHIDTFVIASGDSDFVPLASKLRENDKYVIGVGVKNSTSPVFVKACDEFLYLKTDGSGGRRGRGDEPRREPRSAAEKRPDVAPNNATPPGPKPKREIPSIAREVVWSLIGRATGPLNPSFIKETIVRREPDFDERDHGFSTFSRLLEAMEKEGLCQRIQQGRQWYVVAKDGAKAPAGADGRDTHDEHVEQAPKADVADDRDLAEEVIPDPEE
jgi:hypothetical protein